MYRIPSARRRSKDEERLNLVPILDAVFILIFFLLFSAQFLKIFEIGSDLPAISEAPPPKDLKKEQLNLTLRVRRNYIEVLFGNSLQNKKIFRKLENDKYQLEELHTYLKEMKENYPAENSITLEPTITVEYQELVEIMDEVRTYKHSDEKKGRLFNQIIFGNLSS